MIVSGLKSKPCPELLLRRHILYHTGDYREQAGPCCIKQDVKHKHYLFNTTRKVVPFPTSDSLTNTCPL